MVYMMNFGWKNVYWRFLVKNSRSSVKLKLFIVLFKNLVWCVLLWDINVKIFVIVGVVFFNLWLSFLYNKNSLNFVVYERFKNSMKILRGLFLIWFVVVLNLLLCMKCFWLKFLWNLFKMVLIFVLFKFGLIFVLNRCFILLKFVV